MKQAGRFTIVAEYMERLFVENTLDTALTEFSDWGRHLDPLDKEQVRLFAVPCLRRALESGAPAGSAERLVDAALGVGAPEEALTLAVV
jgi:hypothetical protein